MHALTIADLWRPVERPRALAYDVLAVITGSLFIVLCTQLAFRLPYTQIPVTGQTFGVLLVGFLLGSRRGAAAILVYISEGAAGFPVFAEMKAGAWVLAGDTAGYLYGFVFAAYLVGLLAERGWDRSLPKALGAMALGITIILMCGAAWLGIFFLGFPEAIYVGVTPFIPGAIVKIILAASILPLAWKVSGK